MSDEDRRDERRDAPHLAGPEHVIAVDDPLGRHAHGLSPAAWLAQVIGQDLARGQVVLHPAQDAPCRSLRRLHAQGRVVGTGPALADRIFGGEPVWLVASHAHGQVSAGLLGRDQHVDVLAGLDVLGLGEAHDAVDVHLAHQVGLVAPAVPGVLDRAVDIAGQVALVVEDLGLVADALPDAPADHDVAGPLEVWEIAHELLNARAQDRALAGDDLVDGLGDRHPGLAQPGGLCCGVAFAA